MKHAYTLMLFSALELKYNRIEKYFNYPVREIQVTDAKKQKDEKRITERQNLIQLKVNIYKLCRCFFSKK